MRRRLVVGTVAIGIVASILFASGIVGLWLYSAYQILKIDDPNYWWALSYTPLGLEIAWLVIWMLASVIHAVWEILLEEATEVAKEMGWIKE
jgi:uncharacterized membrane protein